MTDLHSFLIRDSKTSGLKMMFKKEAMRYGKCVFLVGLVSAKTVAAPAQMMKSYPKSQGYLAVSQVVEKGENLVIQ